MHSAVSLPDAMGLAVIYPRSSENTKAIFGLRYGINRDEDSRLVRREIRLLFSFRRIARDIDSPAIQ